MGGQEEGSHNEGIERDSEQVTTTSEYPELTQTGRIEKVAGSLGDLSNAKPTALCAVHTGSAYFRLQASASTQAVTTTASLRKSSDSPSRHLSSFNPNRALHWCSVAGKLRKSIIVLGHMQREQSYTSVCVEPWVPHPDPLTLVPRKAMWLRRL